MAERMNLLKDVHFTFILFWQILVYGAQNGFPRCSVLSLLASISTTIPKTGRCFLWPQECYMSVNYGWDIKKHKGMFPVKHLASKILMVNDYCGHQLA